MRILVSMPGIAAAMLSCAATWAKEAPVLVLTGTVVGTGIRSSAVLMDAEGTQRMFYEGGHVGGAKIETIKEDRIILLVGGERQALMLRGRTGGSGAAEAAEEAPTLPPNLMPPPPPPAPVPAD
uniref:type II secretion system protein N n=1 Tax=Candidatus Electronema sp. TaxID=2698783 RepID=UPI004055AFD2